MGAWSARGREPVGPPGAPRKGTPALAAPLPRRGAGASPRRPSRGAGFQPARRGWKPRLRGKRNGVWRPDPQTEVKRPRGRWDGAGGAGCGLRGRTSAHLLSRRHRTARRPSQAHTSRRRRPHESGHPRKARRSPKRSETLVNPPRGSISAMALRGPFRFSFIVMHFPVHGPPRGHPWPRERSEKSNFSDLPILAVHSWGTGRTPQTRSA